MMTQGLRFKEIEHKFVVDAHFDMARFRDVLATLNPTRTGSVHVQDDYFLTEGGRNRRFVIRHRYDAEARVWLQKWADYLESLTVSNVVPLRAAWGQVRPN